MKAKRPYQATRYSDYVDDVLDPISGRELVKKPFMRKKNRPRGKFDLYCQLAGYYGIWDYQVLYNLAYHIFRVWPMSHDIQTVDLAEAEKTLKGKGFDLVTLCESNGAADGSVLANKNRSVLVSIRIDDKKMSSGTKLNGKVEVFSEPKEVGRMLILAENINVFRETVDAVKPFIYEKVRHVNERNTIGLLCQTAMEGFTVRHVTIGRNVDVDLKTNYNDDFIPIYDTLVNFLESNRSGLAILHGQPGCGKTFLIRHLLSILETEVIYIPPDLIRSITEPSFLQFISQRNNFVLVAEDAEEIVTSRDDTKSSMGVANLLNLSDGLLGDCIQPKIICTFNTDIKKIDQALLRKGRLVVEYEFKPLAVEKANQLLKKVNINYTTKVPMSLADIYNFSSDNFHREKQSSAIGFGAK